MASITIRKLDERVKRRLRQRAAEHGHSMEAEARDILRTAVNQKAARAPQTGADLYDAIRRIVEPLGGIEIPEMPSNYDVDAPDFK